MGNRVEGSKEGEGRRIDGVWGLRVGQECYCCVRGRKGEQVHSQLAAALSQRRLHMAQILIAPRVALLGGWQHMG